MKKKILLKLHHKMKHWWNLRFLKFVDTRETRPPLWHLEYIVQNTVAYCLLSEDGEPSTFHEHVKSLNKSLWMTAMQEEIEALDKNKTWDLVSLP